MLRETWGGLPETKQKRERIEMENANECRKAGGGGSGMIWRKAR